MIFSCCTGGSSSRGGAKALREMLRAVKQGKELAEAFGTMAV